MDSEWPICLALGCLTLQLVSSDGWWCIVQPPLLVQSHSFLSTLLGLYHWSCWIWGTFGSTVMWYWLGKTSLQSKVNAAFQEVVCYVMFWSASKTSTSIQIALVSFWRNCLSKQYVGCILFLLGPPHLLTVLSVTYLQMFWNLHASKTFYTNIQGDDLGEQWTQWGRFAGDSYWSIGDSSLTLVGDSSCALGMGLKVGNCMYSQCSFIVTLDF